MNTMLTLILLAGGSPLENAVQQLQNAFTGPIAKGLSLVAIVVGGLMFAFGEGGNKRMFAGSLPLQSRSLPLPVTRVMSNDLP
jgi:hypothetical protein